MHALQNGAFLCFRLMSGGELDASFAERVVGTVLEGYAPPAR